LHLSAFDKVGKNSIIKFGDLLRNNKLSKIRLENKAKWEKKHRINYMELRETRISSLDSFLFLPKIMYKKILSTLFQQDISLPSLLIFSRNQHFCIYLRSSLIRNWVETNIKVSIIPFFKLNPHFSSHIIGVKKMAKRIVTKFTGPLVRVKANIIPEIVII
jgi:hypothetical protein